MSSMRARSHHNTTHESINHHDASHRVHAQVERSAKLADAPLFMMDLGWTKLYLSELEARVLLWWWLLLWLLLLLSNMISNRFRYLNTRKSPDASARKWSCR